MVEKIIEGLNNLGEVVPRAGHSINFHNVVLQARAELETLDEASISEKGWNSLEDILAGCVPDIGRKDENVKASDREEWVNNIVTAIRRTQAHTLELLKAWDKAHEYKLETQRLRIKHRELARAILRAWREETDGVKARKPEKVLGV